MAFTARIGPVKPADAAPRNARAGRGDYFRGLLSSRTGVYAMVLGCSAALVYGAYRGQPELILGGPLVVAALVVSVCWFVAARVAALRFFSAFADANGLTYVGDASCRRSRRSSALATASGASTGWRARSRPRTAFRAGSGTSSTSCATSAARRPTTR